MADDAIMLHHPDEALEEVFGEFTPEEIGEGARGGAVAGDRAGVEPTADFAQVHSIFRWSMSYRVVGQFVD